MLKPSLYRRHNSAAILFVALWTLVILSILAIGISNRLASEIRLTRYLESRVISLYLAKAALNQAIIELEKDPTPGYDTLYELQTKRTKDLGKGSFEFTLTDEESRININTAPVTILERLPGLNPDLAQVIFESGLKPFQLKEELLLVEGVTSEIFLRLKDLITVYGEGKVNINTASSEVLRVLGLEDDLIEIILAYRKGEDGEEVTEDDRKFQNIDSILENLNLNNLEQELQITALLPPNLLLCVAGNLLKLDVETKVLSNPVKNYSVIFERAGGRIRFWQER